MGYDNPKVGWLVTKLVSNHFAQERNGTEFGKIICRSKIGSYNLDNPKEDLVTCFVVIDTLDAFENRNQEGELFYITDHILNDKIGYIYEKIKEETKERFRDKTQAEIEEHVNSIMKIIQDNIEVPADLKTRTKCSNPINGFKVRKKEHENWFRRHNDNRYPKSGTSEAYTIRDFIYEEYYDLIQQKALSKDFLMRNDPEIIKPLNSYIKRIQLGNIVGKNSKDGNIKHVLLDTSPSVRTLRKKMFSKVA